VLKVPVLERDRGRKDIIVSQGPVAKEEIKAVSEMTLSFSCSRSGAYGRCKWIPPH